MTNLEHKEEWKEIDGTEGRYFISSFGRVYSKKNDKILKQTSNGSYLRVTILKNKRVFGSVVHRMVAKAFIPNPNSLPQVNHINENKEDNRAVNLEWCTPSYNCKYSAERRVLNRQSKRVVCLNTKEIFSSVADASKSRKSPLSSFRGSLKKGHKHKGERWVSLHEESLTKDTKTNDLCSTCARQVGSVYCDGCISIKFLKYTPKQSQESGL